MLRGIMLVGLTCWLGLLSGCRCMPAMEKYHATIDYVSDKDWVLWERLYYPPWDASRAGRPDWCWSSWNRKLCPCRCQQGIWGGYCDQQHYPPNYPYSYPSQAVPLVGILTSPKTGEATDMMRTPSYPGVPTSPALDPVPAPSLEPAPKPNPAESGSADRPREGAWLPTSFRQPDKSADAWMEIN